MLFQNLYLRRCPKIKWVIWEFFKKSSNFVFRIAETPLKQRNIVIALCPNVGMNIERGSSLRGLSWMDGWILTLVIADTSLSRDSSDATLGPPCPGVVLRFWIKQGKEKRLQARILAKKNTPGNEKRLPARILEKS